MASIVSGALRARRLLAHRHLAHDAFDDARLTVCRRRRGFGGAWQRWHGNDVRRRCGRGGARFGGMVRPALVLPDGASRAPDQARHALVLSRARVLQGGVADQGRHAVRAWTGPGSPRAGGLRNSASGAVAMIRVRAAPASARGFRLHDWRSGMGSRMLPPERTVGCPGRPSRTSVGEVRWQVPPEREGGLPEPWGYRRHAGRPPSAWQNGFAPRLRSRVVDAVEATPHPAGGACHRPRLPVRDRKTGRRAAGAAGRRTGRSATAGRTRPWASRWRSRALRQMAPRAARCSPGRASAG